MPFTDELKRLTDAAHSDAEQSTFIEELLRGDYTIREYARLLAQYLPLYTALEAAAQQLRAIHPLSAFHDERLHRATAIRRDLEILGASSADLTPLPATTRYVDRLNSLAADQDATRILAHHYLRYLGDLSGGQIIGRLAQRHYDVPSEALNTWDFSALGKGKVFKDDYRAKLNSEIGPELQDAFVDECLRGYQLAGALFADLEATPVS